jgi:hypothetical protein
MDCTFETDPRREASTARMDVLEHGPAAFLKEPKPVFGRGSFWNFAATACIFQEACTSVRDDHGHRLELKSETHTFF